MNQVISIEVQVLTIALPPLVAVLVAYVVNLVSGHIKSAGARAYAAQVVAWAQQTIPDKNQRYIEAADLLARKFPGLRSTEIEVLIEASVAGLKAGLAGRVPAPVPVDVVDPAAVAVSPGFVAQLGPQAVMAGCVPSAAAAAPSTSIVAPDSAIAPVGLPARVAAPGSPDGLPAPRPDWPGAAG